MINTELCTWHYVNYTPCPLIASPGCRVLCCSTAKTTGTAGKVWRVVHRVHYSHFKNMKIDGYLFFPILGSFHNFYHHIAPHHHCQLIFVFSISCSSCDLNIYLPVQMNLSYTALKKKNDKKLWLCGFYSNLEKTCSLKTEISFWSPLRQGTLLWWNTTVCSMTFSYMS